MAPWRGGRRKPRPANSEAAPIRALSSALPSTHDVTRELEPGRVTGKTIGHAGPKRGPPSAAVATRDGGPAVLLALDGISAERRVLFANLERRLIVRTVVPLVHCFEAFPSLDRHSLRRCVPPRGYWLSFRF